MANRNVNVSSEVAIMGYAFVKWLLLAAVAGLLVGAGTGGFVWLLEESFRLAGYVQPPARLILLPIGFLISTVMVQKLAPDAKGHGTEKVIEAVHERQAVIDVKVIPVKLLATVVTLAGGGSAGKEGPAAQIGAGLMSVVAQLLRFSAVDRRKLVICGISAGFAAIFGTPVAGAVFGVEVLFVGQLYYDVMFPSIVSGVVSWRVATLMGIAHPTYFLDPAGLIITPQILVWVVLAGAFFGLVALMNVEMMSLFERLFEKFKVHYAVKALIGAAAIAVLGLMLGARYMGLGMDTIGEVISGLSSVTGSTFAVPLLGFFWKSLFTCITLACGGSGGVVTPIFFIGATAGATFATLFGLNAQFFGGLGMVALLAGCANAPIAATLMGMELFGAGMGPFAAMASMAAFLLVGHHSIYPSQILARSKSPLIALPDEVKRIDSGRGYAVLYHSPIIATLSYRLDRLRPGTRRLKAKKSASGRENQ